MTLLVDRLFRVVLMVLGLLICLHDLARPHPDSPSFNDDVPHSWDSVSKLSRKIVKLIASAETAFPRAYRPPTYKTHNMQTALWKAILAEI